MKTGSTSATAPRSSAPASSGSSTSSGRTSGRPAAGGGAERSTGRAADRAKQPRRARKRATQPQQREQSAKQPGSRSAQPPKSSRPPRRQTATAGASQTAGRIARLRSAWGERLARWGERLSRPWEGAGTSPQGRRGDRSGPARDSEQATLTYYCLLISTLVLETFGLIMVFSVQSVTVAANGGNAFTDFAKYLIFAAVGTLGMVGVSRIPLSWFPKIGRAHV